MRAADQRLSVEPFLATVLTGLLTGSVYALIAAGLALEFGIMRVINFAHGFIVMLAMFLAALMWEAWGFSPYLSALILAPAAFFLGVGIYLGLIRPFLRRGAQPIVIALVTLAGAVVVEQAIVLQTGARPRAVRLGMSTAGLDILGVNVSVTRLVAALVAVAALSATAALLHLTAWGRRARAVAQDPEAAKTLGIHPERISAVAFGIGSALAAVAGTAVVTYTPASPAAGLGFSLISFVIVVLGGLSSFRGAWVGGLLVGLVASFVGYYGNPGLQTTSYLVIFVVVLVLRPQGLFGDKGDLGEIRA